MSIWAFWTWPSTNYVTKEEVGYYEEYLGTREEQIKEQLKPEIDQETGQTRRVPKRGPGKCSTIVCNHAGYFEMMALVASNLQPAFVARI